MVLILIPIVLIPMVLILIPMVLNCDSHYNKKDVKGDVY